MSDHREGLPTELSTERLLLRRWVPEDREPFAALNADPRVMKFFPEMLDRAGSDATADRIEAHFRKKGYGLWAVEISGVTGFAGFIGLATPRFEAHFTPCVEAGWRLAHEFWGQGYATEGARAAFDFGFELLGLDEIIALTTINNLRSRRVMERLGMHREPSDDFDHPLYDTDDPLRQHVLYRMRRASR